MPFEVLKDRLHRRLAHGGIQVEQVEHEEFCLFPMNLPLPDLSQQVQAVSVRQNQIQDNAGPLGAVLQHLPRRRHTVHDFDLPMTPKCTSESPSQCRLVLDNQKPSRHAA